ncbi:aminotransferase class V-fold PLP-dependent enzyme [Candidatus Daviesbacteria bacterium]|nr:aminotransferase class V-fold PLP-dependent enzyme [Candidatus Daviesbacteria bacterium]
MKKVYFAVGPSQVYPTLYKHINKAIEEAIPCLNHRGDGFKSLYKSVDENLKKLLNIPKNYQIFFVSSALESMERTIQGLVEKNSFHIITGSFGKAWANYANQLNKTVTKFELESNLEQFPDIEISTKAEIICITQNDTSTGFWFPPEEIIKLKKKYPEKLIAIDVVSSAPYLDINFKYIDVTFFSVQKGFGLPAGLGILIVSPKTLEKAEKLLKKGLSIGSYHSLKNLSEKYAIWQTPETPNELNIYLLDNVIKDMLKIGLANIRKEIDIKANLLYGYFDSHKKYQPFIKNPKFRSPTTLVIDVKGESEKLRKKLENKGYIMGAGYGDNKLNHIRIANFPSHQLKDVKAMLNLLKK